MLYADSEVAAQTVCICRAAVMCETQCSVALLHLHMTCVSYDGGRYLVAVLAYLRGAVVGSNRERVQLISYGIPWAC
jgi:hypothetical protein